jgi:hypothetical protein
MSEFGSMKSMGGLTAMLSIGDMSAEGIYTNNITL